jgi:hypothetical protein
MIFDRLDEYEGGGGFDGTYCPEYYNRKPTREPGYSVQVFDRYADEDAVLQKNKSKPSPLAMLWLKEQP